MSRLLYALTLIQLTLGSAAGQEVKPLPFDISRTQVASIDTTRITWSGVRSYPGGVEGTLTYQSADASADDCKAVSLLGAVHLKNIHQRERVALPVYLRLDLVCGSGFGGRLEYNGVNTTLRVVDLESAEAVYEGRTRGLAPL